MRGRLFGDAVPADIAAARGKSVVPTALRWLVRQRGFIVPIPRAGNPTHIAERLNVFDFEPTTEEMARFSCASAPGRIADPKGCAAAWVERGVPHDATHGPPIRRFAVEPLIGAYSIASSVVHRTDV